VVQRPQLGQAHVGADGDVAEVPHAGVLAGRGELVGDVLVGAAEGWCRLGACRLCGSFRALAAGRVEVPPLRPYLHVCVVGRHAGAHQAEWRRKAVLLAAVQGVQIAGDGGQGARRRDAVTAVCRKAATADAPPAAGGWTHQHINAHVVAVALEQLRAARWCEPRKGGLRARPRGLPTPTFSAVYSPAGPLPTMQTCSASFWGEVDSRRAPARVNIDLPNNGHSSAHSGLPIQ
jgi:hypothetical protein